jgi:hypothetical protein
MMMSLNVGGDLNANVHLMAYGHASIVGLLGVRALGFACGC